MRNSRLLWMLITVISLCSCKEEKPTKAITTDVMLHTQLGNIGIHLYDDTPQHRQNFISLAEKGFFDSLTFHRVIHNFVVQTGDPRSRNQNWSDSVMGPGYQLDPEFSEHHVHVRGAVSMARKPEDENPGRQSSGSQFFFATGTKIASTVLDSMEQVATGIRRGKVLTQYIQEKEDSTFHGTFDQYLAQHPISDFRYPVSIRNMYEETGGVPHLDFTYTVFGQVSEGLDIVMKISRQPAQEGRLLNDVRIDSVTVFTTQP